MENSRSSLTLLKSKMMKNKLKHQNIKQEASPNTQTRLIERSESEMNKGYDETMHPYAVPSMSSLSTSSSSSSAFLNTNVDVNLNSNQIDNSILLTSHRYSNNNSINDCTLVITEKSANLHKTKISSTRKSGNSFQLDEMKNVVKEICASNTANRSSFKSPPFDDTSDVKKSYGYVINDNHDSTKLSVMKRDDQSIQNSNDNSDNKIIPKVSAEKITCPNDISAGILPIAFQSNKVIKKKQLAWVCSICDKECIPIRSESRCLCGHRLKDHDEMQTDKKNGKGIIPCKHPKCKCKAFYFIVADGAWILR